ncbi:hypothetical protein [Burkholderia gladioli]|uniref:hypothetical protein n=1 Tax=Burkholderia gladioli TaxID=28095 RepID=UPI001C5E0DD8|nr:hypothetical protein [Burkholderia gladioli]MBW5285963.1 hypothetical protein [Burkholderia gladioli]
MSSRIAEFNDRMQRIGMEALAVHSLELSMIAQLSCAPMSDEDRREWGALLLERRQYLASKIDEAMSILDIKPLETLESLRRERARRAR